MRRLVVSIANPRARSTCADGVNAYPATHTLSNPTQTELRTGLVTVSTKPGGMLVWIETTVRPAPTSDQTTARRATRTPIPRPAAVRQRHLPCPVQKPWPLKSSFGHFSAQGSCARLRVRRPDKALSAAYLPRQGPPGRSNPLGDDVALESSFWTPIDGVRPAGRTDRVADAN